MSMAGSSLFFIRFVAGLLAIYAYKYRLLKLLATKKPVTRLGYP